MTLKTLTARLESILFDPRLWAGLLFMAGLYWLDLPYYDDHAPRQAGTATIARNFYAFGINPFYPLSDICGAASPDYFATEFPLLQVLTTLLYYVFGEHYWVGRFVNWSVSCLGLVFFARLTDRVTDKKAGLFAMFMLIGSITLAFMRKMMPDTFSLFLVIIGTYYFFRYLDQHQRRDLLLGTFLATLGVLSKIPSVMVLTLLVVPLLNPDIPLRRKRNVGIGITVAGLLTAGWYFAWMPHLQEITHCPPLIFPVSLAEGFRIFFFELPEKAWQRFHHVAFYGPWPLILAFVGVGFSIWKQAWSFLLGALAYLIIFFLYAFKTGHVFPTHTYYIIPLIPLMSIFVGQLFTWSGRWKWLALVLTFVMIFEPVRKTGKDIYLYPAPVDQLGQTLDGLGVAKDDLIMINDGSINPTLMFYARRRGWTVTNDILTKYEWMNGYRAQGLKFLVV
ncbi:MAG: ArnT family glycosyltransferase, partial [Lewinella sp.]